MATVELVILKLKLDWSDFQPVRPNTLGGFDAEAGGRISVQARGRGAAQVVLIAVRHTARVETDTVQTAALLLHEQGHLDLTIIAAHRMKVDIEGGMNWNSAARQRSRALGTANTQYDNETNHGTDAAAQARWNAALQRDLRSFEPNPLGPCFRMPGGSRDPYSFGFAAGQF